MALMAASCTAWSLRVSHDTRCNITSLLLTIVARTDEWYLVSSDTNTAQPTTTNRKSLLAPNATSNVAEVPVNNDEAMFAEVLYIRSCSVDCAVAMR